VSNRYSDDVLRHLTFANEKLARMTSAVMDKKWAKAAEEGSEAVFRISQLVKGLDNKAKEEKK
jgi:hypothetical protein